MMDHIVKKLILIENNVSNQFLKNNFYEDSEKIIYQKFHYIRE